MGLFDKKFCDVCGEKIGLLGNRKLEDGNLCKTCAGKLSPFFSERRASTVADIKAQLAYREENKTAVAAFHTTRTIGRSTKLYLDEDRGVFMVTAAKSLTEANPDVISFADVTGCDLEIEEERREVYRQVKDQDGHTRNESYSPRRYKYSYDFNIRIQVNHPYFNEIKLQLNSSSVAVDYREGPGMISGIIHRPAGRPPMPPMEGSTTPPPAEVRRSNSTYAEFEQMGEEIRAILLQARQELRDSAAAAAAPRQKVVCPFCGATTLPDETGCCEYCGGSLG